MYIKLGLFIDGNWKYESNTYSDVLNPADETVLGKLPHASQADLEDAVDSAKSGFKIWKNTSPEKRGEILINIANLIDEKKQEIAEIMTLEQGKILPEAIGEVERAVDSFQWNGEQAKKITDYIVADRSNGLQTYIKPQPVGVTLGLTAWNFPIILIARKLAPALASGCSMILKASEETPGTAVYLCHILEQAGLPKGVVNLVFGIPSDISNFLFQKKEIRKVSFTGSVPVGKMLAKKAASTLKRLTLELGGHSPAIVAEDANLEKTLDILSGFKFRNAGQVCIAPSRFFIHDKIYDQMLEGFVKRANKIKLGNGLDETTTMGPMANERRLVAMKEFVDDATIKGANVLTGGRRYGNSGFFWEPTIIENISKDSDMLKTEIFGPIMPLIKFNDYDEVIEEANCLDYGLASYVYTEDKKLKDKMSSDIEAGGVSINSAAPMHTDIPYGGFKESGIGYEGGQEAIDSYMHKKNINIIN